MWSIFQTFFDLCIGPEVGWGWKLLFGWSLAVSIVLAAIYVALIVVLRRRRKETTLPVCHESLLAGRNI